MKRLTCLAFSFLLCLTACNDRSPLKAHPEAKATSKAGIPLPKGIIYTSQSLISGKLYARPSFDGTVLAYFDTSQLLYVIDTTESIFVKALLLQDTSLQSGYIPKVILPQLKQR